MKKLEIGGIYWKVVKSSRYSWVIDDKLQRLHYPAGHVVTAPKNSIGVLCFTTRQQARGYDLGTPRRRIIKVKALTLPVYKPNLCACGWPAGFDFQYMPGTEASCIPGGTIGIHSVKVLT